MPPDEKSCRPSTKKRNHEQAANKEPGGNNPKKRRKTPKSKKGFVIWMKNKRALIKKQDVLADRKKTLSETRKALARAEERVAVTTQGVAEKKKQISRNKESIIGKIEEPESQVGRFMLGLHTLLKSQYVSSIVYYCPYNGTRRFSETNLQILSLASRACCFYVEEMFKKICYYKYKWDRLSRKKKKFNAVEFVPKDNCTLF